LCPDGFVVSSDHAAPNRPRVYPVLGARPSMATLVSNFAARTAVCCFVSAATAATGCEVASALAEVGDAGGVDVEVGETVGEDSMVFELLVHPASSATASNPPISFMDAEHDPLTSI
jgi:hypothetical protein